MRARLINVEGINNIYHEHQSAVRLVRQSGPGGGAPAGARRRPNMLTCLIINNYM